MKGYVYEIQIGPYKQIGSTSNIDIRKYNHIRLLKQQKHYNEYLQRVYNTYQDFRIVVLYEFKSREEAYNKEQELLEKYYGQAYYTMLQRNAIGGSEPGSNSYMFGKKHKEETKLKIGLAHKGKIVSEETKTKLSLSRKNLVNCKNSAGEIFTVSKVEYDSNPELVGVTAGTTKLKARKTIQCIETGVIYNGIVEAGHLLGVPPGQISENLKGKRAAVGQKKYKNGLRFKLYNLE